MKKLVDVNEHLVREFYANTAHVIKGTKATKVHNFKVISDQHTLNIYLGLEGVEAKE